MNIFHRCGRRLDLLRDQRRKLLSRPKGRPFPGEPVYYGEPGAFDPPPPPARPSALDAAKTAATHSSDTPSGENVDRRDTAGADRDPPLQAPTPADVDSHGEEGTAPDMQSRDALADAGNLTDVGADRDPPQCDPAALTLEQGEIEALEAEDNRWRAAVDRTALSPPPTAPANVTGG